MVDKFVLLTPLIIFPLLLLFSFVGCALDTNGIAFDQILVWFQPVALYQQGIVSIQVTINVITGISVPNPVNLTSGPINKPLAPEQQLPLPGGYDSVSYLPAIPSNNNGPFTVECTVLLTPQDPANPPLFPLYATKTAYFVQGGGDYLVNFSLDAVPGEWVLDIA
jgi:hypothetical protein